VRSRTELSERLPDLILDLAQIEERAGKYADAIGHYTAVQESRGDPAAWEGMASTLRKQGRYGEALDLMAKGLEEAKTRGQDVRPFWLHQAWTLNVTGRLNEAMAAAQMGLEADTGRQDLTSAYLQLQFTRAQTVTGRYQEAIAGAVAAEKMFENEGDLSGLSMTYLLLGHAYKSSGDLDEAASALRRGLGIAERIGNAEQIAGCLINLALVEQDRGHLDEAIAYDRRAAEEFEQIGHGAGRAIGYGNLAEALARRGDYEEAAAFCEQSLEIARSIGHEPTIADVSATRALILLRTGKFALAAAQGETAAELFLKMGAHPSAANALRLSGEALDQLGEKARAAAIRGRANSLVSQDSLD
jgi:tetratricopeptide (TPR) repeat protein